MVTFCNSIAPTLNLRMDPFSSFNSIKLSLVLTWTHSSQIDRLLKALRVFFTFTAIVTAKARRQDKCISNTRTYLHN